MKRRAISLMKRLEAERLRDERLHRGITDLLEAARLSLPLEVSAELVSTFLWHVKDEREKRVTNPPPIMIDPPLASFGKDSIERRVTTFLKDRTR